MLHHSVENKQHHAVDIGYHFNYLPNLKFKMERIQDQNYQTGR